MPQRKKRLTLGKATTRRVSQQEADLIRESAAQQQRPGGQSAAESREIERRRKRRRERRTEEKEKPKKEVRKAKVLPTIQMEKPKKTLGQKALGVLTSPKTTVALATTLATLIGGGAIAAALRLGRTGTAVITRTGSLIRGGKELGSLTTQRAFVGKAGKFALDKAFHAVRPIVARFATNPKTIGSSTSMIAKLGLTLGAASLFVGAVGSYPFAGFIKEEALQTLNIGIFKAVDSGDFEGADKLIGEVDEILEAQSSILSKIPYVNVLSALRKFFDAAAETNEEWKRIIEIRSAEAAGEQETEFAKERRESDEAARQRKLEAMEFDAEYFALIREGRFDEANEILEEQMKGGA